MKLRQAIRSIRDQLFFEVEGKKQLDSQGSTKSYSTVMSVTP